MEIIDDKNINIKIKIMNDTNNNKDIIFKNIELFKCNVQIIYCESLTNRDTINDYVLEFFEEKKNFKPQKIKDMITYIENNIPSNKVNRINNYSDLYYALFSGFSIITVEGYEEALSLETKAMLNSNIESAKTEPAIKGPKDAFTENYQINLGMIKKRIKSEKLWMDELILGNYSHTKIGILHIDGIASKKLVKMLVDKISKINIDSILDSNYIIESITGNIKNVFPTYISTERPDTVSASLMKGKIAIVVENTPFVLVIPIIFADLFHTSEDLYQKPINANYTRFIRFLALFITLLTPALYVALTTYNHETIPSELLVNFSIQRDGVPLPTIFEAILMIITFEILKETDTRIPSTIGSSLSIVGALVLGDAAVTAGIVSPIMVIVIAITSISGLMVSYFDAVNGLRWWRLIFLIGASILGVIGIFIVGLFFIINLTSISSLGLPYIGGVAPFQKQSLGNNIFLSNKRKMLERDPNLSKNITRGVDSK